MTMQFTNDNRGVSEVIGAILVFGLLIALMAIIQTQAIPAANEEVEFNHNQDVQSDLVNFHATASRVLNDGEGESVSIQMGTTYPARMLFFSPHNPQGTLRATEPEPASINNVRSPNPNIDTYIGTSRSIHADFRALEYSPGYNEYSNAPTTRYEYGGLYNEFEGQENETVSDPGNVVDGREISLISVAGNVSQTAGGTRTVSVNPAAASPSSITITNQTNGPLVMTLPTTLSNNTWGELLDPELVSEGGYVLFYNLDASAGQIEIGLKSGELYNLEMPRITIADSTPDVEPAYIAPSGSGIERANPGQSVELTAEVRDEYNNPIPDTNVTFDVPNGPTESVRANSEGVASFVYTPSGTGNQNVDVRTDEFNGALNTTNIEVQVGGSVAGPVVMTDSSRTTSDVTFQVENEGGIPVGIERIQLQYAAYGQNRLPILSSLADLAGGETIVQGPTTIEDVTFLGTTDTDINANQGEQPQDVSISSQLASGSTADLTVSLDQSVEGDDRLLINVRVFYSGGYSESYAVMLTA